METKTILLVDDEERFLHTTKQLLQNRGFHIDIAGSGMEALDILRSKAIQLVVLDVKMPEMDGIATLKRIKREFPGVIIIMLTGHATVENAVEGIRLGARDYLMKPVDVNDLADKIDEALVGKKSAEYQSQKRLISFTKIRIFLYIGALLILLVPCSMLVITVYGYLGGFCHLAEKPLLPFSLNDLICFDLLPVKTTAVFVFLAMASTSWIILGKMTRTLQRIVEKRDLMQFQLYHASKLASIGELACGVAHEINNPLAIIVARSGIIQDLIYADRCPEDLKASLGSELELIHDAAFRARNITRQLISFGPKRDHMLTSSDVNRILEEAMEEAMHKKGGKSTVNIKHSFSENLPAVTLDATRMKQALLNIIENAYDAVSDKGMITLSTELKENYVEISISDSGKGMNPDQMNQIFKPFYSTKKTGEGVGLSLSISLNIVESHGGTIDVRSIEKEGSTFIVTLPVA